MIKYRSSRVKDTAQEHTWVKVVAACALFAGLSWGPVGSLFIPATFHLQAFVVFVLIGVTAAANFYYTPLK